MGKLQDDALLRSAQHAFAGGDLARARAACDDLLRRNRKDFNALALRAQIALRETDYEQAASFMLRCAALRPKEPGPHLLLGEIYASQGRFREAINRYDRVLRAEPRSPRAIAGKAEVHEKSGERDKARALLRPLIEAGGEPPELAMMQARLDLHDGRPEAVVELLGRHVEGGRAGGNLLRHLCFLLGRALERTGRHDEAFDAYRRGNEAAAVPFDRRQWARTTDEIIEAFSREAYRRLPRASHGSRLPVFIVGMPRCGSTLVETIIDAHPRAHAGGELVTMHELIRTMSLRIGSMLPYPRCVEDLAPEDVEALAADYVDHHRRLDRDAERITDKLLSSYRHLGLVHVLFPEAAIIHCTRNPMDICFSCWLTPLSEATHPWASDLEDVAAVYLDYEKVMTHWRDALKVPMLEVRYEHLVEDQERVTRDIIEFCGLPWDDHCLRYFESGRFVQTASYDQVNRPVYRSSVSRHKAFGERLAPLRDALIAGGWTPEAL